MATDLDKFIFISTAIPFGSNGSASVEIPLGGALSGLKQVWSDIIPIGSYSISPRVVYTIPPGTWSISPNGFALPAGSRVMGGQFFYRASTSPPVWVSITPSVKYEGGGVRLGVTMLHVMGSGPTTMPSVNLKIEAQWDVIPNSIK